VRYFSSENECVGCHVDCASCDGPSFDDCSVFDFLTVCCVSTDCDKSCLTCSGHEPSDCLSCSAKKHKDASGHCVWDSQCSPGSYLDQNGECRQCHALCQNCSGPNRDHCLSCKPPHLLLNSTCVKSCPLGYYAEKNSELSCGLCHFGCESCVGRHSQQCVTCKTGFFKHARSCVETCPQSHFKNMNTMTCQQCDPSCSQCSGPGNQNCLKCRKGFVYLRKEGRCLQSCPEGYHVDRQSICQKCHPTCKTCDRK
uniref:Growth factor receptor domain-containing protein n=1 Tax=Oryzias melastigma TaxID=30732 RepID=A0A3B3CW80_ORYME